MLKFSFAVLILCVLIITSIYIHKRCIIKQVHKNFPVLFDKSKYKVYDFESLTPAGTIIKYDGVKHIDTGDIFYLIDHNILIYPDIFLQTLTKTEQRILSSFVRDLILKKKIG
jgi:hypothetical protein